LAGFVLSPREPGLRKKPPGNRIARVFRSLLFLLADGSLNFVPSRENADGRVRERQRNPRLLRALGLELGFAVRRSWGRYVALVPSASYSTLEASRFSAHRGEIQNPLWLRAAILGRVNDHRIDCGYGPRSPDRRSDCRQLRGRGLSLRATKLALV